MVIHLPSKITRASPPPTNGKAAKKGRKRSCKDPVRKVPTPAADAGARSLIMKKSCRGEDKLKQIEEATLHRRANFYKKHAQVIRAPFTCTSLMEPANSDKTKLAAICVELRENQPAQCMSAQVVDKDGKPILFYFGERIVTDAKESLAEILLEDQYKNRTQADLDDTISNGSTVTFDGLHPLKCRQYQVECQRLVIDAPLHSCQDHARHEKMDSVTYMTEGSNTPVTEEAGVLHVVQGWIQQGQKKKGLFLSGDISRTSTSIVRTISYYTATADIARALAIMFKTVFPDTYKKYREAFDAGVWFIQDPGPFLGRAIVYKLQGRMHRDNKDVGPSACFPVGNFINGDMIFPQLRAKFNEIYHLVTRFEPKVQTAKDREQNVTPGRIGSVFFFPKHSYTVLEGKPKGWAAKTNYDSKEIF